MCQPRSGHSVSIRSCASSWYPPGLATLLLCHLTGEKELSLPVLPDQHQTLLRVTGPHRHSHSMSHGRPVCFHPTVLPPGRLWLPSASCVLPSLLHPPGPQACFSFVPLSWSCLAQQDPWGSWGILVSWVAQEGSLPLDGSKAVPTGTPCHRAMPPEQMFVVFFYRPCR